MGFVLSLNAAPTGGFVVAGGAAGVLRIRTDDGSTQKVVLRAAGPLAAAIDLSASALAVGPADTLVDLTASTASTAPDDGVVEVVAGRGVAASYAFTAIAAPEVQFEGRFQCRLATDPDGFDHPWGVASSFGLYAVQGPTPAAPYEPPLDRIVRFHDPVAVRPFCPVVGVTVRRVRGRLAGGDLVSFAAGDSVLGLPVRIGPACKFDARDGVHAQPGFEPISDFQIYLGTAFFGESDPGVARPDPSAPPPTNAPYADGFFRMDLASPLTPADLGYPEADWTTRAVAVSAKKLVDLNAQVAVGPRDIAIRDRRIQEHTLNMGGLSFTLRMMERYTGIVDRNVAVTPGDSAVLAAFQAAGAVGFYAEFFDFDSDCQIGTVWGTLGTT